MRPTRLSVVAVAVLGLAPAAQADPRPPGSTRSQATRGCECLQCLVAFAGSRVAGGLGFSGVCAFPPGMRELDRIPPDLALAELAGRQWGVVSLAQLRVLGIARSGVTRRGTGRLRRVYRGVYAVGGAVLPREGRWLAAVMACGPRAVLSHVSAAVHWGSCNTSPRAPR
jgi:hypothetical protein